MMTGGALINALAFSGTNFLFSQFGGHGEEIERHNKAMETTQLELEMSSIGNASRDWILSTKRFEINTTLSKTFSDLGAAMQRYYKVTSQQLPPLREPKLSDFYNPGREHKDTELLLVAGGMVVLGVVAYKYL